MSKDQQTKKILASAKEFLDQLPSPISTPADEASRDQLKAFLDELILSILQDGFETDRKTLIDIPIMINALACCWSEYAIAIIERQENAQHHFNQPSHQP